jgi:hypothetical protein
LALLGQLIKRYLKIQKRFTLQKASHFRYQEIEFKRLLTAAEKTQFGRHYNFSKILKSKTSYDDFVQSVPYHNYSSMYKDWWRFSHEGEADVAWPGKVKYFALSSGTSESASKHIPVTDDMIKSTKKTGFKQFCSLLNFNLSDSVFSKGVLMLGGTTALHEKGDYYEGDMSGISAKEMPKWLSFFFYKPGQKISKRPRWEDRINLIVRNAKKWDVSIVAGVPAWVQIVLEKVVEYHKVNHIHEIWPNLSLYIHGGVSFEPYRDSFKNVLGHSIEFIETYMASEGSFGFQSRPGVKGISLVTNNSIFYEFVPFTAENFTDEGEIKQGAKSYRIHEVVEDKDYAIVVSTCSGAWRYLIGDVLRFTDVAYAEIIIVGRTKQFLSLCGEHLSADNMNKAIEVAQQKLGIVIKEFTVVGLPHNGLFAHRWYVSCDTEVDNNELRNFIDATLCELNDDYEVERTSALKEVFVEVLPSITFLDFLEKKGKTGAMNKFPRVMKGKQKEEWEDFVEQVNF